MRFTRREFLSTGGRSLVAASAFAQFGCAPDKGAAELEARIPDLMKKLQVPGVSHNGWHCMSGFSPVRKTGFVIMTNGEGGAPMIFNELLKTLAGTLFP